MKKSHLQALGLTAILVVIDLGTKAWIASRFRLGESKKIIPKFFDLTLVHNTGAAFGQGSRLPTAFFIIMSIVAIGVVVYLFLKLTPSEKWSRLGLILITSGAIGNLVDRIRLGYVVDFLDVYVGKHHWPAFNAADAWITIGAILFALDLVIRRNKENNTDAS